MLIKPIVLEGVEGDGGLEDVLKVDKTKKVLSPAHGGLFDKADALESWKWTKDI